MSDILGWSVGTCCAIRASLSICSNVVLPELSKPRNTNLPDFLYNPEIKQYKYYLFNLNKKIKN